MACCSVKCLFLHFHALFCKISKCVRERGKPPLLNNIMISLAPEIDVHVVHTLTKQNHQDSTAVIKVLGACWTCHVFNL